jgi:hypothetical protein
MNIKKIINSLSLKHLIFFTLLVVMLVLFFRIYFIGKIIPGNEIYFDFSIIKEIEKSAIPINLEFSSIKIPYIFNVYDLILLGLLKFMLFEDLLFFLGSLFAISIPFLLYSVLVKFDIKKNLAVLSCLVFILSPIFISLILGPTRHVLGFILFLIMVRFIFINSRLLYFLEIIILVFLALIGVYHLFVAFLFLLLLIIFKLILKKKNLKKEGKSSGTLENTFNFRFKINKFENINFNKIFSFLLVLFLVLGFYYLPLYLKFGTVDYDSFSQVGMSSNFFSDFQNSSFGFGAFTIILFFIGFVMSWKYKRVLWPLYILFLIIFAISMFEPYMMIYLNVFVSVLVMLALINLVNYRWTLIQLKNITIYLVFLGLLFSFISYLNFYITTNPDREIRDSLEWLRDNTNNKDEVVFSHYKYSNWINFFAEKKVMVSYYNDPEINSFVFNETDYMFSLRNIVKATEMFDKYNVGYIWIHADMRNGLVWSEEDEGLLFLLSNTETFSKIYESKNIEIYKVKK